jgi:hypothetical protein
MMRPTRPFLVGLVCWALIAGGMFDLYKTMKQLGSPALTTRLAGFPYPASVAETILFGTLAIFIISGICIYEGQGWARYVYLVAMVPFLAQSYLATFHATYPDWALKIWMGELVLVVASVVFLFLPRARRFFHPPLYIDD